MSKKQFFNIIIDVIKQMKGCFVMPTVYHITENGLICLWYILSCIHNCEFAFLTPDEVLQKYTLFSEKYPKVKDYSFNKEQLNVSSCNLDYSNQKLKCSVKKMNNGKKNETFTISYKETSFFEIKSYI